MAIALCHTLPRDNTLRLALVLCILSFTLLVAGLGSSFDNAKERWASFETSGSGSVTVAFTAWEIFLSTQQGQSPATRTDLCPAEGSYASVFTDTTSCEKFVSGGKAASIMYLIAACLLLCCAPAIALSTSLSEKNTRMMVATFFLIFVPTVLCISATAVFAEVSVPAVRTYLKSASSVTLKSDTAATGVAFNCLIAATAFLIISTVLALARLIAFIMENRRVKEDVRTRAAKYGPDAPESPATDTQSTAHRHFVDERLQLRIVNDDWDRQQTIWEQRKQAVSAAYAQRDHEEQEEAENLRKRTEKNQDVGGIMMSEVSMAVTNAQAVFDQAVQGEGGHPKSKSHERQEDKHVAAKNPAKAPSKEMPTEETL
jgi:hypothetical protein